MTGLSPQRCVEAITEHSRGLAAAAEGALRKRVEHCPDWNVGDLVWHVTQVHWFWRTIVAELLSEPPEETRRPPRPAEDELVDTFLAGADALTQTLHDADQQAACWTWHPPLQQVSFVTRHQVQEAAVHHWDAVNCTGGRLELESDVAADSVEEFLTCSLADAEDAARTHHQQGIELGDEVVLHAVDTDQWWTVRQEGPESALLWTPDAGDPTVEGTAADLLLWLYGRRTLAVSKQNLVNRFRRLTFTD